MIYTYSGHCSRPHGWERICTLTDYEKNPLFRCPQCGELLDRVFTPPCIFTGGFEAFVSPVDGRVINSRRELHEHNRRNNVVQLHEGYDEKAVQGFTSRKWGTDTDKVAIKEDMKAAVQKLEEGYKPVLAPETDPLE